MHHRLIADAMLGRLARWLRALGHDVVYDPDLDDAELAHRAAHDHRTLLTRDRRLCSERGHPPWCVVLESDRPRPQLLELHDRLALFHHDWDRTLFTRCMVCNAPLAGLPPEAARRRLPDAIRDDPAVVGQGVRACPHCDRVYWEGSHTRRMRDWLRRTAGQAREGE